MSLRRSLTKRTNEPLSPRSDRFLGQGLLGCCLP
jgi:hypothetical protein